MVTIRGACDSFSDRLLLDTPAPEYEFCVSQSHLPHVDLQATRGIIMALTISKAELIGVFVESLAYGFVTLSLC